MAVRKIVKTRTKVNLKKKGVLAKSLKNKVALKKADKNGFKNNNRSGAVEKARIKVKNAFKKMVGAAKTIGTQIEQNKMKPTKQAKRDELVSVKSPILKPINNDSKAAKAQKGKPQSVVAKKLLSKTLAKKALKVSIETKNKEASPATVKRAAARIRCREIGCEHETILSGYCRLHYIKNWRRIKKKESILSTKQLETYVEELVAKYPDKYLDAIENDLAAEKEWVKVISDLELGAVEEDFVPEEDDAALAEAASRRGSGFEDDGDDVY